MKPHRLNIIDRIHGYASDSRAEEWKGTRDWYEIKRIVKGLVRRLRDDDEIVNAETNRILVRKLDGFIDVYINVGTWSE